MPPKVKTLPIQKPPLSSNNSTYSTLDFMAMVMDMGIKEAMATVDMAITDMEDMVDMEEDMAVTILLAMDMLEGMVGIHTIIILMAGYIPDIRQV